ncbi:MAG: hypothetical protein IJ358_01535 [Clostridia bacterium]|nr:hypothetical protein [Clostridia bacterium]
MDKNTDLDVEFNTLYGNLEELHRRVEDKVVEFPKQSCCRHFVYTLNQLLEKEELIQKLTADQIDNIIRMGMHLVVEERITEDDKLALYEQINIFHRINTKGMEV